MGTFRRQTPGETGPKGVVTWCALKLEPGCHEEFFTLGHALWFWSHWRSRSVPCYSEFTGGKEPCPYCGTRDYWQGYLPVCNEVGQRYLVLVKENNKPIIDKLQVGAAVMVSRKSGKGEPTTVRPAMRQKFRSLTDADERAVASIESALVVMWRDDFFKQWFAANAKPDDTLGLVLRANQQHVRDKDALERAQLEALQSRSRVRQKTDSDNPVSIGEVPLPVLNGKGHGKR